MHSAEKSLNLPLPEMTFGNNSLDLLYSPSSSSTGSSSTGPASISTSAPTEIRFSTLDALAKVAVGEGWEERVGGGVQVSMAEAWGKSRCVSYPFGETMSD